MERTELTAKICPVHGPVSGEHCRVLVESTKTHRRYCHMEQDTPVVPRRELEATRQQLDRLLEAVERHRRAVGPPNHTFTDKHLYETAQQIRKEADDHA